MVDLNDYFNPVSIESPDFEHLTGNAGFPHNITIHTENNPIKDLSKFKIALLGSTGRKKFTEYRLNERS